MITLCGILEDGYESSMELLIWRQLKGAFQVNLALVPIKFERLEDAIENTPGERVFLVPPWKAKSVDLRDFVPPKGDAVYIFGRPGEDLLRLIEPGDMVVSIATPGKTDLMAVTAAGILLNELG